MTTNGELVLAIDLGTTAVKAALVDIDGQILSTGRLGLPTIRLPDGGVEQDPAVIWSSVLTVCKEALADPALAKRVITVSCCSQYSSIVPVDENGEPVMNFVMWLDHRGATTNLRKYPGGEKLPDSLYRKLRWLRIHGIPPLDSGVDSLAHMRWIKLARPEVYAKTKNFLEAMDFVVLRLTGRAVANQCSAFLMLLTDNRVAGVSRYSDLLVRYSGIDKEKLPELVPIDAEVGTVLPSVAEELGLGPDVKVFTGLNDTQVGGVTGGTFSGNHVAVSMGTTSVMITHVKKKKTDILNSLVSMPSPFPGTYLVMAENGIGGRAVEHFLSNIVFATDGFGNHSLEDRFLALHTAIANVPPGSGGVLFLPWLDGSLSPAEDGLVRGGFLNMSLDTTREHLGRAVLEGVALNMRWLRDAVESFTKRPVGHVIFYGGGAVSDAWSQIIADVQQIPVHQLANARFAVCLGTGLLGFVRSGRLTFEDCVGRAPVKQIYEPRPELRQRYDTMFGQFVQAFRKNRKIFHALGAHPWEEPQDGYS